MQIRQGQHIVIEDAGGIRRICAFSGELALVPLPHPFDQAFSPGRSQLPQLPIWPIWRMSCSSGRLPRQRCAPQAGGPQCVGRGRIPSRHMDAVGYGSIGTSSPRPARKQGLEDLSAYLSVQLADAIDLSAAPYREISHVERFRVVFRVLSSQSEQIVHRDREFIDRMSGSRYVRMSAGSKRSKPALTAVCVVNKIPGSRNVHGKVERLLVILHVAACPFEHGKRCMTFVKVTYLGLQTQRSQQTPTTDTKDDLLLQPHLCVPAIELAGDTPMGRCISKVVGIEKIQLCSSH